MTDEKGWRASISPWYAVAVLVLLYVFSSFDRTALPLQAEQIRHALHLNDVQLGMLQDTGIAIFSALAAYPIAWLSDRFDRRLVLSGCVLVWSSAVLLSGFTHNIYELVATTSLMGAGGAGLLPISLAMIASLFVGRRRQLANSFFMFAIGVGGALALTGVGHLISSVRSGSVYLPSFLHGVESWRIVFGLVATPAPLLLLLIASMPRRRDHASAVREQRDAGIGSEKLYVIGYIRARMFAFLGVYGAVGFFALGQAAVSTWIFVIMARVFGQTPAEIGTGLGAASLAASPIGLVLSATLSRILSPRLGTITPNRLLMFAIFVIAGSTATMSLAAQSYQIYALFFVCNVAIVTAGMTSPSLIQNIGQPSIMARLFAIMTILSTACAAGAGPLVGLLSESLKSDPRGLLLATVTIATPAFIAAGMCLLLSEGRYRRVADAVAAGDAGASLPTLGPTEA